MSIYDDVENSYRKFKGHIYYDKNLSFLRSKVALFENEEIDEKLHRFADALLNDNDWQKYEHSIVNSIKLFTFPKSIKSNVEYSTESAFIFSNIQDDRLLIDDSNYIIDLSVEGYILGMLWVQYIGEFIDSKLSRNCYGNRLNNIDSFDGIEGISTPYMFRKFIDQYKEWKKNGIKAANAFNKEHKSVLITLLDLKKYYYSVNVTNTFYSKLTEDILLTDYQKRINNTVFRIIEEYSRILNSSSKILPLCFAPSSIIANYYLFDIDKTIQNQKNILYYGRYVDDIMILQDITTEVSKVKDIICNENPNLVTKMLFKELFTSDFIIEKENSFYLITNNGELKINESKIRFFLFDKDGNNNILSKIIESFDKGSNEFNYVPDIQEDFEISDVLSIDSVGGSNKLRDLKSIGTDKYELSKFISRGILLAPFMDDNQLDLLFYNLSQLFDNKEIIECYSLWENILNCLIISGKVGLIINFTSRIIESLNSLDEQKMLDNNRVYNVKSSLIHHYVACVERCFSCIYDIETNEVLYETIQMINKSLLNVHTKYNRNNIDNSRELYLKSCLYNKNYVFYSHNLIRLCKDKLFFYNWYSINEIVKRGIHANSFLPYKYLPFINSPFDIGLSNLISDISVNNSILEDSFTSLRKITSDFSKQFNIEHTIVLKEIITNNKKVVSFKSNPKEKIKIAVANVLMNETDIMDSLLRKPTDRSFRLKEISELANLAVKNKADILVFPEAYIPLSALHLLDKICKKSQMMIICGIEHFISSNQIWNLTCTLVPVNIFGFKYSIPFWKQKRFFTPEEKRIIKSCKIKNCKIAKANTKNNLFNWKGFNFSTYCCYDLSSINNRSAFIGEADVIFAVEWNKDVNYFSNIIESLSRDMYCYCVQSNMSKYGDSRIVQPKHSYYKDILKVKGGENSTILIGEIDIQSLRCARKNSNFRKENEFAELPAGIKFKNT